MSELLLVLRRRDGQGEGGREVGREERRRNGNSEGKEGRGMEKDENSFDKISGCIFSFFFYYINFVCSNFILFSTEKFRMGQ